MSAFRIVNADVVAALRDVPDNSVDGVLCDPPYGLSPDGKARDWDQIAAMRDGAPRRGFMGKEWDAGVPGPSFWREVLRVCKPGAHIAAFGSPRTFHRLAAALEDAGADIRDTLMFLHGQGFPKSSNVAHLVDRHLGYERKSTDPIVTDAARTWKAHGTALKPAFEPIVLARKPLDGTVAQNVTRWGVGALAIDASRIEGAYDATWTPGSRPGGFGDVGAAKGGTQPCGHQHPAGRWPPNLCLDEVAAAALDEQTGTLKSGDLKPYKERHTNASSYRLAREKTFNRAGDSGGASRFFYVAKVSTAERERGCEALPDRRRGNCMVHANGTADTRIDGAAAPRGRNHHPTLKPIALTRRLARLIMPPSPGTLLVPFSGAGSEMIGALDAGWDTVVGIELEPEYAQIAEARIAAWHPMAKRSAA